MRLRPDIRPGDGRPALGGLALVGTITAGHAVLETARDSLFLTHLPVAALPWAYLGIAAITLAIARTGPRRGVDVRRGLALLLAGAAAGTLVLWALAGTGSSLIPVALYLWTGTVSTTLLSRFWVVLADVVTPGQAKRVYPLIGAGALIGPAAGSLVAGLLLGTLAPAGLLAVAAGILGAAAFLVPLVGAPAAAAARPERAARAASARLLVTQPYMRRLLLLSLATTATVTLLDYLFKGAVAARVPAGELGPFFARTYATLSVLALFVQIAVAPMLLRRLGVVALVALLPLLLVAAIGAYLLTGALAAVAAAKLLDGALRNSLARVGGELLLLPLSPAQRRHFKSVTDVLGTRGGQALTSILILVLVAAGACAGALGGIAIALAAAWLLAIWGLRWRYLDAYRAALREGRLQLAPDLAPPDLPAIETLVGGLSSVNDEEVVAAMELLAGAGKPHLIPTPMIYHGSARVARRALELLPPRDLAPAAARLDGHPDDTVRALGLRARLAVDDDALPALADPSPLVRATAAVWLLGRDPEHPRARAAEAELLAAEPIALIRAAGQAGDAERLQDYVERIGDQTGPVLKEIAAAARALPSPSLVPRLVAMLAHRDARLDARAALLAIGAPALEALAAALEAPEPPRALRRHLPRAIAEFHTPGAAAILTRRLPLEEDGAVRYRILRGLNHLRAQAPDLALDAKALHGLAERIVARVLELISWRLALGQGRSLLVALLRAKQAHAVERLFRVLALLEPHEDLRALFVAVRGADRRRREASLEILANVVPPRLRPPILALVDDIPDAERLQRAGATVPPLDEALAAMQTDRSVSVRVLSGKP